MDSDGSNQVKLTTPTLPGWDGTGIPYGDFDPAISPDGTKICFERRVSSEPYHYIGLGDWDIYVMDIDGSNEVDISLNTNAELIPTWAPDSNRIAFWGIDVDVDYLKSAIYIINADGSGRRKVSLPDNMECEIPSWFPAGNSDGFEILFDGEVSTTSSYNVSKSSDKELFLYLDVVRVNIEIPAGTFTQDIDITVTSAAVSAPGRQDLNATNLAVEITPESVLQPQKNMTITMSYNDADVAGMNENNLTVCRYNDTSGTWEILTSTVNTGENTVAATTEHLSRFLLAEIVYASTVDNAIAYPSPFSARAGHSQITFANLTGSVEIRVYNIAGELVWNLEDITTPTYEWNVKNNDGEDTASGLYFYVVKSALSEKNGKFAITR
jgi:TolB protein